MSSKLWNLLFGKSSDSSSDNNNSSGSFLDSLFPYKDYLEDYASDPLHQMASGEYIETYGRTNLKGFLGNLVNQIGALLPALVNRITAEHLTGAEQEANAFNAEQAQLNRDFEREMASTQYQRGVADMQAAGVNPALAMSQGGNVVPSGTAASSAQPQGSAFNMSDLFQLMLIKPQMKLMEKQGQAVEDQGKAALQNAKSNARNATSTEKDAETRRRLQITDALLANNQIKIGDSIRQLNSRQMEKIAQDIRESASRIELQDVEKLAKQLQYDFDVETYETNKELVLQQLVYRAVEMSEMRSVAALNGALKHNAETQGEILDADAVGEKLSAEWKKQNPRLFKFLEAAGMGTSVIGNVLSGSFGWSSSRSKSHSDVDVRSNSRSVSDVTTHKGR